MSNAASENFDIRRPVAAAPLEGARLDAVPASLEHKSGGEPNVLASCATVVVSVLIASIALVVSGLALSTWITTAPAEWTFAGIGSSVGALALAARTRDGESPPWEREVAITMLGLAIGAGVALATLALALVCGLLGAVLESLPYA